MVPKAEKMPGTSVIIVEERTKDTNYMTASKPCGSLSLG